METISQILQAEISPTQIVSLFYSGSSISNIKVTGDLFLQNCSNSSAYLYENCSFDKITISNIQVQKIHFKRCTFKEIVVNGSSPIIFQFTACISETLSSDSNSGFQLFFDTYSEFKKIIVKGECQKLNLVNSKCLTIELFTVMRCDLYMEQSPKPNENETAVCKILLEGVKDGHLTIINCEFNELHINDSSFNLSSFDDSKIDSLQINRSNVKSLNFNNSDINTTKLINSALVNLEIIDGKFDTFRVGKSNIDNYELRPFDSIVDSLKINTLILHELSLSKNSKLDIRNLVCEVLSIDEIKNQDGEIKISDSIIKKSFSFEKANLGNAMFSNLNLKDCLRIKTLNSSFTNSKFFNVQWNRNYRIYEYSEEIKKCETSDKKVARYLYPLRESYRQLIAVSNKELNKIDALFFQKQELRIYYEITKFDKLKSWTNFQDFLILGSNKVFSDFGQNIWLPLKWWIPIHSILFWILISSHDLGVSFVNPNNHSWKYFLKGLGIYINLLNPIHSSEINKVSVFGVTDFLIRIFGSYFLFYFINATRKFHLQK